MNTLGSFVMAVAVLGAGIDAGGQRQERGMGGIGITVYEDRDFRGRNATFRNDVPDLRDAGMNDRIQSLEVAPGEMWEVCEHTNYGGRCQVFTEYEPDLRQRGWAREISSMRRVRGGGYRPPGGGYYPPPGDGSDGGLVLYSSRNYGGKRRTLAGPTPDLRALGFNDEADSLRLPRGQVWEVCRDIDYVGCLRVDTDWPDLRQLGDLGGEISSARPYRRGGGGWNPRPRAPYPGGGGRTLVLFSGVNFTGRSYTVQDVERAVDMPMVQSVRVDGGNWQICEDADFRGRCTTVNVDVGDIRSLGLPGRVRSARLTSSPD